MAPADKQTTDTTEADDKHYTAFIPEPHNGPAGTVRFGYTNIYIDPEKQLTQYSQAHAPAYKARDTELNRDYIVILTGREAIPRFPHLLTFKNLNSPYLQQYYRGVPVYWPKDRQYYFACLFDAPRGHRMMDKPNGKVSFSIGHDFGNKYISAHIIDPALKLLQELQKHDVTHGNINLFNMFGQKEGDNINIMFGECVSAPPSYGQHPLFEPISRALAQPSGRGHATEKHDLYSLGVSVALLALGKNPMENMTVEQIIARKVEHGSYSAIVGRERLPGGIAEFLRAVLNDEYPSRWGLEEAQKWIDGSRMTTKPPRPSEKATRPFVFADNKYSYLRNLVNAFARNEASTVQTLKDKKFSQWLHRNIADKAVIANFDKHFGADKALNKDYSDQNLIVAQATMALDPDAPIRYKNLSILPRGYGTALAHAVLHNENTTSHLEILQRQLYHYWFEMQYLQMSDASLLSIELEKSRNLLRQKMAGRGFERVLYTLCKETHCLSPKLKGFFVRESTDLLSAFETLASRDKLPAIEYFFDRHIIAYLLVHESKAIEPYLSMISSADTDQKIIGLMRCFSSIQKKYSGKETPHLIAWFIHNIKPALSRIHDRKLRQHLNERIHKLTNETQFSVLLEFIDNIDLIHSDTRGFLMAKAEYQGLQLELNVLQRRLSNRNILGTVTGRQAAMLISVVLSSIVMILTLINHFELI